MYSLSSRFSQVARVRNQCNLTNIIAAVLLEYIITNIIDITNVNKRKECIQETQHTHQTTTRTTRNQDIDTTIYKNTEHSQKQKTSIYQVKYGSAALDRSAAIFTGDLHRVYERST